MLISGVVAMQLICVLFFAYAESKCSHDAAQILSLAYVICALTKYVCTLERYTSNFEH